MNGEVCRICGKPIKEGELYFTWIEVESCLSNQIPYGSIGVSKGLIVLPEVFSGEPSTDTKQGFLCEECYKKLCKEE